MPRFIFASRHATEVAIAIVGFAACVFFCGCTPSIGDHCALSTDCSVQGTRICDTSQPNGYCTLVSCNANSCPDNAACVEFGASLPGCPYNDYGAPSRVGRSMCMKRCGSSSDCRQSEGYSCVSIDRKQTPWTVILDTTQASGVCMIAGGAPADASNQDAQVCSWDRPDAPPLDAPITLAPIDEASDESADAPVGDADSESVDALDVGAGATESGADAPNDVTDGHVDANAGVDTGSDAQADQTLSTPDSGALDAPAGG